MTDDISKVVREMRDCAKTRPDTPLSGILTHWAARLESATTPAEVGDNSRHAEVLREIRDTEYAPHDEHGGFSVERKALSAAITALTNHATLARQLAEAKAENREVLREVLDSLVESQNARAHLLQRVAVAESKLAEATRRLGEVEADMRLYADDSVDASRLGRLTQHWANQLEAALKETRDGAG